MKITEDKSKIKNSPKRFNISCSLKDIKVFYALCYRVALGGDYPTAFSFMEEVDEELNTQDKDLINFISTLPDISIETEKYKTNKVKQYTEDTHNITIKVNKVKD